MFEILQGEFEYAIENLNIIPNENSGDEDFIDIFAQHLFTYYLWNVYPLTGDSSMLERFYTKSQASKEHWRQLFTYVGHSVNSLSSQLKDDQIKRIIDFFNWRLKSQEPLEFNKFFYWLSAECLKPEWRLESYSKILDLRQGQVDSFYAEISALNKLYLDHLKLVVKCFAKITDTIEKSPLVYIPPKSRAILEAGFVSRDDEIRRDAELAQKNLLSKGYYEYLL